MSDKFYVIEYDQENLEYNPEKGGVDSTIQRVFYVSSGAKSVDPTDIKYAKLFPTVRSAKQAWVDASQNPTYYEVEIDIKILRTVNI